MRAVLVTHTHWDREWYRTFQAFRARLVDAVDRVLDLCAADRGYHFLLDGQTVALEDYLEVRPDRAAELRDRCSEGRIAIGPWYVQPDSLLPSGEAHVRNLLLGRSVGESIGPVSRVGYTPDSFGHPAQFPQILSGFGIGSFLYWRGNGNEIDELPTEYAWEAPDGSHVLACHLARGYFSAATPPDEDLEVAAGRIAGIAKALSARTRSPAILLLNGIDHAHPEPRTAALANEIARASGIPVQRGLLEDFVSGVEEGAPDRPRFRGELVGARVAPLLAGVWSTRTWIKLHNRRCETALEAWAEPWAALAQRFGAPDERPSLRLAWKELLKNQAHDSICGCSRDAVHEQMRSRYDAAEELAEETTSRCLERLTGHTVERRPPWSESFDLAVVNPSPHPRTDVVRLPLDPHPNMVPDPDPRRGLHPFYLQDLTRAHYTVDGVPARLVPALDAGSPVLVPPRVPWDLEFVARDVPAFGWRRLRVCRASDGPASPEAAGEAVEVAPGSSEACIRAGETEVSVRSDGSFDVRFAGQTFGGLGALEDVGDRGDSYDFDPLGESAAPELHAVRIWRSVHPGGIQRLRVERSLAVSAGLEDSREERSQEQAPLRVGMELRLAEGVERVDLQVRVEDAARDHRLRMLFPLPVEVERFHAASTFEVAERTPGPRDGEGWVQAPPATFPQQGFVCAGGLTVVAPGLSEAELVNGERNAIAITLLRCVGHLSRQDLASRPGLAGPGTATPGAQCPEPLEAHLALLPGLAPARARDAELGLKAVACGAEPLAEEGRALLSLAPDPLLLTALKPAEDGDGLIVRVLNPGDEIVQARLTLGFPYREAAGVRLDEEPAPLELERDAGTLRFPVPPRALRSLRIR